MEEIERRLATIPFFEGLTVGQLHALADCGGQVSFPVGTMILRERQPAEQFYVILEGRVALEVYSPNLGAIVVESLDAGEVLGWSWMIPPYRWQFDAHAVGEVRVLRFDAACLRAAFDEDPALGYALLQRLAKVMGRRLRNTRLQLLDLFGRPAPIQTPGGN